LPSCNRGTAGLPGHFYPGHAAPRTLRDCAATRKTTRITPAQPAVVTC
jgi:hypothetical protein